MPANKRRRRRAVAERGRAATEATGERGRLRRPPYGTRRKRTPLPPDLARDLRTHTDLLASWITRRRESPHIAATLVELTRRVPGLPVPADIRRRARTAPIPCPGLKDERLLLTWLALREATLARGAANPDAHVARATAHVRALAAIPPPERPRLGWR